VYSGIPSPIEENQRITIWEIGRDPIFKPDGCALLALRGWPGTMRSMMNALEGP
jgi:hypothetical protein